MKPERLNAFTDGVVAIIITIMVLELKVPAGSGFASVRPALPLMGAYALSFVNVAIFWNNHHHMMQATRRIDGRVLWSNAFLLFWLSLIPFVIRWIGEEGLAPSPVAAYGLVLTMAAFAYWLLERTLLAADETSPLHEAVRASGTGKELTSLALYACAVPAAFLSPWLSIGAYVAVALMWLVPDRRVERIKP